MGILIGMDRIRAHPGLQAELARALGITRGAVAKWKSIPPLRVLEIERLTGISKHDLRPDIYPPPLSAAADHKLAQVRQKIKANTLPAAG